MRDPAAQRRDSARSKQLVHGSRNENGNQLLLVEPLHQLECLVPELMLHEDSGGSLDALAGRLGPLIFKLSLKKGSKQRMHVKPLVMEFGQESVVHTDSDNALDHVGPHLTQRKMPTIRVVKGELAQSARLTRRSIRR